MYSSPRLIRRLLQALHYGKFMYTWKKVDNLLIGFRMYNTYYWLVSACVSSREQ